MVPVCPSESRNREGVPTEVPRKYEKYGHVLIIQSNGQEITEDIACLLAKRHRIDVIISSAPSAGELRVPEQARILWKRCDDDKKNETLVQHRESGITYCFDPLQVMFSSGNVNERSRFGSVVTGENEFVLDMFAGIGYFSLPLATNRLSRKSAKKRTPTRPSFLVAIEKNTDSFNFLSLNFSRYKQTACPHKLVNGDNRDVGDEYIGKCDRILMGYLPETKQFIPRALEFAKKRDTIDETKPRAILHYHFIFHKDEVPADAVARDFVESSKSVRFVVHAVRRIKSYTKNRYHGVADVHLL
ncbi:hypothetical protein XU18_3950 [Perkinsela sp. CCAP 1560/4]|nr:hypothetical protein XU18_3950 [Perkinsela sp. CCAP 1560/4]|eukprot:KNH04892.1 hypothetical protein XU18_3950 [Perkinsela sp. CCAP 1560/4]